MNRFSSLRTLAIIVSTALVTAVVVSLVPVVGTARAQATPTPVCTAGVPGKVGGVQMLADAAGGWVGTQLAAGRTNFTLVPFPNGAGLGICAW